MWAGHFITHIIITEIPIAFVYVVVTEMKDDEQRS